jgi:perosamine synthetase
VGLMGDFGCYSFNEFKHLSCGDGGIVGTNSAEWGEGLSRWGDKHYDRVTGGRNPPTLSPNYRITEPQSAVAGAQLERHDGIVAHRRRLGQRLSEGLRHFPGITVSEELPGAKSSYWFLLPRLEADTVRVDRDTFVRALKAEGVSCGGAYIPQPVPGYPLFQNHDFFAGRWPLREAGLTSMDYTEMQFPQAENLLSRCITLALHEAMTEEDIDFVIAGFGKLLSYYAK